MPISAFQHINLRSTDVERTREFYVRILGLRVGDRPPFASSGYWLYVGDQPIVHLVQRHSGDTAIAGSGNLDHVAFSSVNFEGTRRALQAAGIPFLEAIVPPDGTLQILVNDPDGIKLELNFAPSSAGRSSNR